jgi:D-alanyl-D-alanine carboxypeptidase (penicillin-binding protein 5/6)
MGKIIKKYIILIIALMFCFGMNINAEIKVDELNSKSLVFIDLNTNDIYLEKNINERISPAQFTAIMVALVVFDEENDLEKTIEVNSNAFVENAGYREGDKQYLNIKNGEKFTVKEYLYAMLLNSGVEAANMLGYHYGGGNTAVFIAKMNTKAAELGCLDTKFVNTHGGYSLNQYTTVNDMAKILKVAVENKTFLEIVNTPTYQSVDESQYLWKNDNRLLMEGSSYYREDVVGIKAGGLKKGENNESVGNLAVIYNGRTRYLIIAMGAEYSDSNADSYKHFCLKSGDDVIKIITWAEKNLIYKNVINKNEQIDELKVLYADSKNNYVGLLVEKNYQMLWNDEININTIERKIRLKEKNAVAPIKKGDVLGTVELKLSGETLATINLIASRNVERSTSEINKTAARKFFSSTYFKRAMTINVILFIIYPALCIYIGYNFYHKPDKAKSWRKNQKRKK